MRLSRTSTSGWKAIESITQFLHPGNVWSTSLQRRWPGRKDYFRHNWAVRWLKSHQWPTNTPLHSGSPPIKAAAGFWVPGYVWLGSVPTSQASYEYGHWQIEGEMFWVQMLCINEAYHALQSRPEPRTSFCNKLPKQLWKKENKPKFPIAQLDAEVWKPSALLKFPAVIDSEHSHGWP